MIDWIFSAIVIVGFLIAVPYLNKRRQFAKTINKIPGPKTYPLIGSTLEFLLAPRNERVHLTAKFHKEFGPLFKVWLGPTASVNIVRPEDAEIILSSRVNINKNFGYKFFQPWLGTGLLTSSGSKWTKRRKMLTPAFHFSILQTFFDIFVENSNLFVRKLETELNSKRFNVFPYIKNCTLDIICETAMGVKVNAQETPSLYTNSVQKINELILERIYSPWLWPDFLHSFSDHHKKQSEALRVLHDMSLDVIKERKLGKLDQKTKKANENTDLGRKKYKVFLDILLDTLEELDEKMTDADIREEVDTFMFEGHDTTASAVGWTIYLLGRHPDIQDKVVDEIKTVLSTENESLTMKNISELKYLECVIKETLRLFPSVPFIARTLTEDVRLSGYEVPSGATVKINIFHLHRQADYFPNPNDFNPSNFSLDNTRKQHPFSYIPFSAGSRNCIGQKFAMIEEKVILATFLRKYKVTSFEKYEDLKLLIEGVIQPENGIPVKIERRI